MFTSGHYCKRSSISKCSGVTATSRYSSAPSHCATILNSNLHCIQYWPYLIHPKYELSSITIICYKIQAFYRESMQKRRHFNYVPARKPTLSTLIKVKVVNLYLSMHWDKYLHLKRFVRFVKIDGSDSEAFIVSHHVGTSQVAYSNFEFLLVSS